MTAASDEHAPSTPHFIGARKALAVIAAKSTVLTVLTFGVYRFWMKTHLRRHYWAGVQIDGEPLEYTGRPSELFLGFLFAVVVLATYLGLVNLALAYWSLSTFDGNKAASAISLFSTLPLIYFAHYRARRYLLTRTRWRGIRLGVENGAWAYAGRAIAWMAASILSLGLAIPAMEFDLERFKTNRVWFGDLKFEQRGAWTGLLKAWLIPWGLMAAGTLCLIFPLIVTALRPAGDLANRKPGFGWIAVVLGGVLVFASLIAMFWYAAYRFRYLTGNKMLARAVRFHSCLRAWTMLKIHLLGWLKTTRIMLTGAIAVIFVAAIVYTAVAGETAGLNNSMRESAAYPLTVIAIYAVCLPIRSACYHLFILREIFALTCRTLRISGIQAAHGARQRAHDASAEAGGFADALDIGGAL